MIYRTKLVYMELADCAVNLSPTIVSSLSVYSLLTVPPGVSSPGKVVQIYGQYLGNHAEVPIYFLHARILYLSILKARNQARSHP